jgi:hypothetical protein
LSVLNHKRAIALAAMVAIAMWLGGCGSPQRLKVRYLPGFVPGSEHIFHPARIAVFPAMGEMAPGRVKVGAIYAADGTLQHDLYANDLGATVTAAVMRSLADAGLKPTLLASASPKDLPAGVDFLLVTTIQEVSVFKRFGAEKTVHGQYFTMQSRVKLGFELSSRAAPVRFKGATTGTEDEPPPPVHKEIFLPLETDPGESLSVALSRAVGALMLQSGFRQSLPTILRPTPTPVPPPTPRASPAPAQGPTRM